jgi:putative aldouronate transport system substrate-binding protein
MKKSTIGLITVALALTVGSTVSLAARQVPKPKQITAFLDTTMLTVETGQKQFCEEYKKQTGIELKIIQPVHNQYYDKLRLAFASGDIPDVVEIAEASYVQYAQEGAFIDLSKYVKASAPLRKVAKTFDSVRMKGKLYGIPNEAANGPITYLRKDWMQNLGLKTPTTWKEFYEVMKAFTHNDPDKNGKNDTYAVTAPGPSGDTPLALADNYYRDFYQDASPTFIFRRGKWIDGFSQPAMKRALTRLRQVYQEKLIDPEIFTNKTSTCREKFQSGKAGIFAYWAGTWQSRLEDLLQKNLGKTATIMPIPPLKGSHNLARVPAVNAITVKAKNPEGIFKYYIEYSHDGNKGQMLFAHGVENVHWKKDGSKCVALPSLNNPTTLNQKAYHTPALVIVPWVSGKDPIDLDPRTEESASMFKKTCWYDTIQVFTDSRRRIEEQLINAKSDCLVKVMTGNKTVEQGWADYKKKYQELKVDQVLKDINNSIKK